MLALSLCLLLGGEFNPTLAVGDTAPAWDKLPGTDGKPHSWADHKSAKFVVVAFTCSSCPVAVGYEDRIIELAKRYADRGVEVLAVNPNREPVDAIEKLSAYAKKRQFPFTYVRDDSQELAKGFGARYTPEFFVLDSARKVVYLGALDEQAPPREPGAKHLEAALDALLAGGKPAKGETLARGCRIRFAK